ncbi:MAG: sacsin N-terminal ATP-binding-like domain-containing protein [Streptosporangiaceae bacterium]
MPADYGKIRDENIARYGWDTAVLDLLGQLYSERTHFIFELIQNAEDAGATELTFELFADRLEVRHDGRPFTEADVRGVCGVGQSGKSGDFTQIGQFGIGFKSVYAYTRSPHIHSGGEHFRIETYVRPYPAERRRGDPAGTAFVFPFDHDAVPAPVAVREISAALNGIEPATLLFLRHITRLRVGGVQVDGAVIERRPASSIPTDRIPSGRHIMLATDRRDTGGPWRLDEEWLVWHRQTSGPGLSGRQVEIAFRLGSTADLAAAQDAAPGAASPGPASAPGPVSAAGPAPEARGGGRRIVRCDRSPLNVFFPTQKETFLGFFVQGPYRTTPARDNVPEHDPANQALVRETAALLADVLQELRAGRWITAEVLEALPLEAGDFPPGSMFRPLFDVVRGALASAEFIPVAGGLRAAADVRLAADPALHPLLGPDQLGAVYAAGRPLFFAHPGITEQRTPVLWRYLRAEIGVADVTPADVAARAGQAFLEAQPDSWIVRYYAFLYRFPALWQAPAGPDEAPGPVRAQPVIRLRDGRHTAPFDAGGHPAAYLPGPAATSLPTVRRAVAEASPARRFLDALNLTEPDIVAEVLRVILPRYDGLDYAGLDPAQHESDLDCIMRALDGAAAGQQQRLLERLQETAFLVGENAATGEQRLLPPTRLYQRTKELEIYFDGNPDVWFAGDSYGPWLTQLRGMGVRQAATVTARRPGPAGHVMIAVDFARNERGLDGFDPGADIDGLEFALRHPSHPRSEYVWNVLLTPNRQLIAGVVERSVLQSFADPSRENVRSAIGAAAGREAWLPGPDGTFRRPAELSLDDLPPTYARDETVAHALEMIQPVVAEAARQLGIPVDVLRGLAAHPDLVAMIETELAARAAAAPHEDREPPPPAWPPPTP